MAANTQRDLALQALDEARKQARNEDTKTAHLAVALAEAVVSALADIADAIRERKEQV